MDVRRSFTCGVQSKRLVWCTVHGWAVTGHAEVTLHEARHHVCLAVLEADVAVACGWGVGQRRKVQS